MGVAPIVLRPIDSKGKGKKLLNIESCYWCQYPSFTHVSLTTLKRIKYYLIKWTHSKITISSHHPLHTFINSGFVDFKKG